ncbi:hypothetical protein SBV1_460050 [Verrucomicrobia bacterium]|nr:hypothetical protein SBV1_460050 [Verrucomicrobiota bacterium]
MTRVRSSAIRVERAYGSFGRSFSLPDDASPAKVTADFKNGVLKVHLLGSKRPDLQLLPVVVLTPSSRMSGRGQGGSPSETVGRTK